MDQSYFFSFLLALGIISFAVWCYRRRNSTSPVRPSSFAAPTGDKAGSDQAFAVGVAAGAMGGTVEDAAVVHSALERAKQDDLNPGARDIGFALGLEKQLSAKPDATP